MPSLPWIKWLASKWLGSSARIEMSLPARAIYLDLLFQIYEYGGSIPSDRNKLIKLAMVTSEEFDAAWPEISGRIVPLHSDPSRLTNPTAWFWIHKQVADHNTAVENGKRGGRPKKAKANQNEKPNHNPNHKGSHNQIEREREREIEKEIELEEEETDTENPLCPSVDGRACSGSNSSTQEDPARKALRDQQNQWFEQFWSRYWRKVRKKKALDAFRKNVRSQGVFMAVMEGLNAQADEMAAKEPQFRPHASTWLNAEAWNDELSAHAADPLQEALRRIRQKEGKTNGQ
jgi:hypothetical protein